MFVNDFVGTFLESAMISAKRYDFHACFNFFALALLIENFVSIAG